MIMTMSVPPIVARHIRINYAPVFLAVSIQQQTPVFEFIGSRPANALDPKKMIAHRCRGRQEMRKW
jgi:hypothetical protein